MCIIALLIVVIFAYFLLFVNFEISVHILLAALASGCHEEK